jgi:dihydroorotate dehydrogenase (NAD+) catalytic subunit
VTVDLAARVGRIELPNPIVAASGTFGHGAELAALCPPSELGAVTSKSVAAFPWAGNAPRRVAPAPGGGMLNAVGLTGPGVESWVAHDLPALRGAGARVIASIWGRSVEEFAAVASSLAAVGDDIVAVEINVSCPNLEDRSRVFAHSCAATAAAVGAVRGALSDVPLLAKLSPNVTDLREIAGAALAAGADGLTLVNTLMGMVIDVDARQPVLAAGGGGLSGPPLLPVALRAVAEVHAEYPSVPIVGTGGVTTGADAAAMLLAGAAAVGVGTATLAEPRATIRIRDELAEWGRDQGVRAVADIVGALAAPERQDA